jgi:hypothetical protein
VIRSLHLEQGLPDPHILQSHRVKQVLTGINKLRGTATRRMEPITPAILLNLQKTLDLSTLGDSSFWCACLLGFFGLLRRSNLFPPSKGGFNAAKHLSRASICVEDHQVTVALTWSKTNQTRDRCVNVVLLERPGHPLCPVRVFRHLWALTTDIPMGSPVFWRSSAAGITPVLYGWFTAKFRASLELCGLDPSVFGTHSLRRGGATWIFECGLSSEAIQMLGDWRSDAYKTYLDLRPQQQVKLMRQILDALPHDV